MAPNYKEFKSNPIWKHLVILSDESVLIFYPISKDINE